MIPALGRQIQEETHTHSTRENGTHTEISRWKVSKHKKSNTSHIIRELEIRTKNNK